MDRFRTSLCLNGVRTSDYVPLHVVDAQTLSLKGKLVSVDDVVELALPSKLATAMMSSMAAVPAHSYSIFLLLGSQVHRGRLGDAVVHNVIRDQACHSWMPNGRQIASQLVAKAWAGRNGTDATSLQYEECLLFGYDGGAVACETLRASDVADTVEEVLRMLQVISLAIFKYAGNKTCAMLVSSHLSTAHMAALFLASHRHVFLYVDETMSAEEVLATTTEMQQVRDSLSSFAAPLAVDAERAQRIVASSDDGVSTLQTSCTLHALAHTGKEYEVLLAAVAREWAEQQKRHPSCRSHGAFTTPEKGEGGSESLPEALRRELEEARAAQRVAEDTLVNERRMHRKDLLSLRAGLESAQQRDLDDTVASEVLNRSAVNGKVVSQNSLHSLQQQHSHHHHSNDAASSAVILQLQRALQDALKAQQFAEEKVHLLELRQSLTASGSKRAPTAAGGDSGAVNSPRPSLRLQPAAATPVAATTPSTTKQLAWEQKLLRQENAALVAEFQRKEEAWQQLLRQALAEAAQLKEERAAMEDTLRLQSQAIAAAQQALVDSRVEQEQEMKKLLERVRVLSDESRSRHRSRARSTDTDPACGSQGGGEVAETGVPSSSVSFSHTPQRQSTHQQPLAGSSRLKAAAFSGGMMSPHR